MLTNLPVPSKNALRALRHLALGTTCTLAIGAGVVTEDRRRRIHAASAVRGNKERIKSSKSYKNGNSDEAFAALISRLQVEDLRHPQKYADDAEPSKPQSVVEPKFLMVEHSTKPQAKREAIDTESLKKRLLQHGQNMTCGPTGSASESAKVGPRLDLEQNVFELDPLGKILKFRVQVSKQSDMKTRHKKMDAAPPSNPRTSATNIVAQAVNLQPIGEKMNENSRSLADDPAFDKVESSKRQRRLAADVQRLLSQWPSKTEAATARFVEAFAEGLPIGKEGLEPVLMTAAIQLSGRLWDHSLEKENPILDIVLHHPPIRKTEFEAFCPDDWITRLLSRSGRGNGEQKLPLDVNVIEKAASIYLTELHDGPSYEMSDSMKNVGTKLCRESCRSGLYYLTILLFRHRERHRGRSPNTGVHYLIEAAANLGNHMDMFRYFQEFYSQVVPTRLEFWNTPKLVVESLLSIGQFEKAEEAVVITGNLARDNKLRFGTSALLKVLGTNWRTYKNIERVQTLFSRMKPLISVSNHPEACYGAIIQCYVEAGDEATAWSCYEELQREYPSRPLQVSALGHLALAKALRHDWTGVEEDFRKIKRAAPSQSKAISISFIPVLKAFASSHSVTDTENFVLHYLHDLGLVITQYLVNFMVHLYAKVRDIDSISRWIQFCLSLGSEVDSVFFNTMLNHCYGSWKFTYQEVETLYRQVRRIDQEKYFYDEHTVSMLRRVKATANYKDTRKSVSLINLEKLDSSVNPESVQLQMSERLHDGGFFRALDIYVQTANEGKPLDSHQLMLAIRATLSMDSNDFSSCEALIQHADECGLDITPHISYLSYRQAKQLLETGEIDARTLAEFYKKSTSLLAKRGKHVPIEMITHAMKLMKAYNRNTSLDFWNLMCDETGLDVSSLDVPALTVFLEIYISQNHTSGVQWTVEMLSTNRLIPDRRFLQQLGNEKRRLARLSIDKSYPEAKQRYVQQIREAVKQVVEIRQGVSEDREAVSRVILDIVSAALERRLEKQREDSCLTNDRLQSFWSDTLAEQKQEWPKVRKITKSPEFGTPVEGLRVQEDETIEEGRTVDPAWIAPSHATGVEPMHSKGDRGNKLVTKMNIVEGQLVNPVVRSNGHKLWGDREVEKGHSLDTAWLALSQH